jgi:hypothetical protein
MPPRAKAVRKTPASKANGRAKELKEAKDNKRAEAVCARRIKETRGRLDVRPGFEYGFYITCGIEAKDYQDKMSAAMAILANNVIDFKKRSMQSMVDAAQRWRRAAIEEDDSDDDSEGEGGVVTSAQYLTDIIVHEAVDQANEATD